MRPQDSGSDELFERLRDEALAAEEKEPAMSSLLRRTVLSPNLRTFEEAVAAVISHRLSKTCGPDPDINPDLLRTIFVASLKSEEREMGHTASEATRTDALACVRRDPACETLLEAVLFFKGFASLVCHRIARRCWENKSRFCALWLQSQASAAFGVDIHPAASIGAGVMLDHGTGIVIGETAAIGDGCTLLHGVTLGGTGKEAGDRHPKVGNDVLIGAGSSVLGNISIGDGAKIGAGSIVLWPVPRHVTAVGVPAKVIGWATENKPGSEIDVQLTDVYRLKGRGGGGSRASESFSTSSLNSKVESESTQSFLELDSLSEDDKEKLGAAEDDHVNKHFKPQRRSSYCSLNPDVCVFRGMKVQISPPNAITYSKLLRLLVHEGCTNAEVGEMFMSLLRESTKPERGYVKADVFGNIFPELLQNYQS